MTTMVFRYKSYFYKSNFANQINYYLSKLTNLDLNATHGEMVIF